jgi:hypothetical protein
MTKAEENLLIEQVAGAFRPRVGEELTYHSAWHDLDAAGRVRAFELSTVLRPIEAASTGMACRRPRARCLLASMKLCELADPRSFTRKPESVTRVAELRNVDLTDPCDRHRVACNGCEHEALGTLAVHRSSGLDGRLLDGLFAEAVRAR